jgi:hypothetical protein
MKPGQHASRNVLIRAALATIALALAAAPPAAAGARSHSAYSVTTSRYRATAVFAVTYKGSGTWHTTYHSTPPSDPANPLGPHDTNDANDSSTQHWSLAFIHHLTVPRCGRPRHGGVDPCRRIAGLTAATGAQSATGSVAHRHVDGLFPAQNQSISCKLAWASIKGTSFLATIRLVYSPGAQTLAMTALTPLSDALNSLPQACTEQGDPIDGLYDSYFMPGFSFASSYGSDRWFTAHTVVIPVGVLHRAARISIPLGETPAGTPPKNCAVQNPSYEQCATGGSWSGMLTFTLRR